MSEHLEQMRAYIDEGGKLDHKNAIELLAEVEWRKKAHEMTSDTVERICAADGVMEDYKRGLRGALQVLRDHQEFCQEHPYVCIAK